METLTLTDPVEIQLIRMVRAIPDDATRRAWLLGFAVSLQAKLQSDLAAELARLSAEDN